MIVVDTSALVEIAFDDADAETFIALISRHGGLIGTPTMVECAAVLSRLERSVADAFFEGLVSNPRIRIVEFSLAMFQAAHDAYRRYGKGQGHPAQLDLGDCLSYAVAKVRGVPLLFKGADFARTDIEPAWTP